MKKDECRLVTKNPILSAAIVLGLAFLGGVFLTTSAFYKVKSLSNTISVTGSAEKLITSDPVKWTGRVQITTDAEGLAEASTEMNEKIATVQTFLVDNSIKKSEITITPVKITASCVNRDAMIWNRDGTQSCAAGQVSGYLLSQTIVVESDKVDEISELANKTAEVFLAQDILFTSEGLDYFYKNIHDLKIEMLGEATKNAKARAVKIAESTNAEIGDLRSASVGVFQIIAPNSTDFADYGRYDTSTVEKKIVSVVRAAFALEE